MKIDLAKYREIDRIIDRAIGSMRIQYPYCLDRGDLKQFAWMRILTRLHLFSRQKGRFDNYIFFLARHAIISKLVRYGDYQYRENLKIARGEKSGSINFDRFGDYEPPSHQSDILDSIVAESENNNLRNQIDAAKKKVSDVSELHLRCFEMHFEQGYTNGAIASIFELSSDKVRALNSYALKLFKDEFERIGNLEKIKEKKLFTITRSNEGVVSFSPDALIKDDKIVCPHIVNGGLCLKHVNVRLFKLKHDILPERWKWLCTKHLNQYLKDGWSIERKICQREYLEIAKKELGN